MEFDGTVIWQKGLTLAKKQQNGLDGCSSLSMAPRQGLLKNFSNYTRVQHQSPFQTFSEDGVHARYCASPGEFKITIQNLSPGDAKVQEGGV